MTAKRGAESWKNQGIRRVSARRPIWRGRTAKLVEALLEFTTLAGLLALLFALFVLFDAAQNPSP
ncbi:hypothetical protein VY88_06990 [Azospirillum thiophilum]|uniref:Uncharacterized protein n=1 Tax=Azospirillum thiophilum TaxID=528244 RepID=A0AAC8VWB5_9PROT|nr:hypothetical protein [Azospirillum thiophilum]ALG70488.1 hypothetical protein AL072_05720 [Azospirillum thiophilum]KJR65838.1 hypothetical protein VY88_06990 [Azospirillum thiophilum]